MSVIGKNIAYSFRNRTMEKGDWVVNITSETGIIYDKIISPSTSGLLVSAYLVKRVDTSMTAGHYCYDIVHMHEIYDIQEDAINVEKYI